MKVKILFHHDDCRRWVGKSLDELYQMRQDMEKKANKKGDVEFYVAGPSGKPALQILFMECGIYIYSARTMTTIGSIGDSHFTQENLEAIESAADFVEQGLTYCSECDDWYVEYKRYSYAGAVCNGCYDPEKHRVPDTRGE
jgi:hypothetical protein